MKLVNILCGMTSGASKYPCAYGVCTKLNDGEWSVGELRSWKNLTKSAKEYIPYGKGNRKNLKFYSNVEFPPIIDEDCDDEETYILFKIPPPPLHIKLGNVNGLMKFLEHLDPKGVEEFTKKINIVK